MTNWIRRARVVALGLPLIACGESGRGGGSGQKDTVVVFIAASLTNAVRTQLDSFAARTGTKVLTESGGSMEHVRKITDLHRVPDLLLLADDQVYPQYLVPGHTTWWADFAHNELVVAYTDKSKGHDSISTANWYRVLTSPGIEVGRADPKLAPVGTYTLSTFALSALFYRDAQLAGRLVANAPAKNVRANATELAALLATGQLDYIYDYESVARSNGFKFVRLPLQVLGRPVTYALSIPTAAPHPAAALKVLEFFISADVRKNLRAAYIDMLDAPVVNGTNAPAVLTQSAH